MNEVYSTQSRRRDGGSLQLKAVDETAGGGGEAPRRLVPDLTLENLFWRITSRVCCILPEMEFVTPIMS